jgi:FixJ family two-component response regulator
MEVRMGNPLVAVIDDDVSVRRALVRLLETAGLRIQSFGSATEFLQRGLAAEPACLVLDIHLGGMSGFELLDCLQAGGQHVPTVLITAHDDPSSRERAQGCGVAAYLRKPLDAAALLKEVFAVLGMEMQ